MQHKNNRLKIKWNQFNILYYYKILANITLHINLNKNGASTPPTPLLLYRNPVFSASF